MSLVNRLAKKIIFLVLVCCWGGAHAAPTYTIVGHDYVKRNLDTAAPVYDTAVQYRVLITHDNGSTSYLDVGNDYTWTLGSGTFPVWPMPELDSQGYLQRTAGAGTVVVALEGYSQEHGHLNLSKAVTVRAYEPDSFSFDLVPDHTNMAYSGERYYIKLSIGWDDPTVPNTRVSFNKVSLTTNSQKISIYSNNSANANFFTHSDSAGEFINMAGEFKLSDLLEEYPDYTETDFVNDSFTVLQNNITGIDITGPKTTVLTESEQSSPHQASKIYSSSEIVVLSSGVVWTDNSPYVTTDSATGIVTAPVNPSMPNNHVVTLTATYQVDKDGDGDIDILTDSHTITIKKALPLTQGQSLYEGGSTVMSANFSGGVPGGLDVIPKWSVVDKGVNDVGETFDVKFENNFGKLVASGIVFSNKVIRVRAEFSYLGEVYANEVNVNVYNKSTLQGLTINGDSEVAGQEVVTFSAQATIDNQSQSVSPIWKVLYGPATITDSGVFTADKVSENQDVHLAAVYSVNGNSFTAEKIVKITRGEGSAFPSINAQNVIEKITLSNNGIEANSTSGEAAVSDNGQYVVYESRASNLIDGQEILTTGIYLYDKNENSNIYLSKALFGGVSAGSFNPDISGDGRFVVFESDANYFVHEDINQARDIIVYDRENSEFRNITVSGASESKNPAISSDGRYVVFESSSSIFDLNDTNGVSDIYLYDLIASTYQRISTNLHQGASSPAINNDGSAITFSALNSGVSQIYVYKTVQGTISLVSKDATHVVGNGASLAPSISGNGQKIAYQSLATNFSSQDNNGYWDIYLYDLSSDTNTLISAGGNGDSKEPGLNNEGDMVVYTSHASNLATDSNSVSDIFLADLGDDQSITTVLVSKNENLELSNGASTGGVISPLGNAFVFASSGTNLVSEGSNAEMHLFWKVADVNASSGRVWLSRSDNVQFEIGQSFNVDVYADFVIDSTLGGGIDISYEPTVLGFNSFTFSPELSGSVTYHNKPNIDGANLVGLSFGAFSGLNGKHKIGTLTLDVLSYSAQEIELTPYLNSTPYSDFYSPVNFVKQVIDYQSLPLLVFLDADGDTLPDDWEAIHGLTGVSTETSDFDNDGLTDWNEYSANTNPNNWDTDGDGVGDGEDKFPLDETKADYYTPVISSLSATPLTVLGGGSSSLSASVYYPPLGAGILSYSWSPLSSSAGTLSTASGTSTVFNANNVTSDTQAVITISVSDSVHGATRDITLSVLADTDGDGMPNSFETQYGVSDPNGDNDNDGLTNLSEYNHGTNPLDSDTDDDGYSDGYEVGVGRTPLANEAVLVVIINSILLH